MASPSATRSIAVPENDAVASSRLVVLVTLKIRRHPQHNAYRSVKGCFSLPSRNRSGATQQWAFDSTGDVKDRRFHNP
jgi:hypothetical protein